MKQIIATKSAPAAIGPYSQAVACEGAKRLVFLSGQIALDPATGQMVTGGIEAETKQVMRNIEAVLNEAGDSFAQVVKTTIFLKDLNDFAKVNEIYGSHFKGDYPARETVEVSRLPLDVMVEISVIAVK